MASLQDLNNKLDQISEARDNIKSVINSKLNTANNTSGQEYAGNALKNYADKINEIPQPVTIPFAGGETYFLNSIYTSYIKNGELVHEVSVAEKLNDSDTGKYQHDNIVTDNNTSRRLYIPYGSVNKQDIMMSDVDEMLYIDTPIVIILNKNDIPDGATLLDKNDSKNGRSPRIYDSDSSEDNGHELLHSYNNREISESNNGVKSFISYDRPGGTVDNSPLKQITNRLERTDRDIDSIKSVAFDFYHIGKLKDGDASFNVKGSYTFGDSKDSFSYNTVHALQNVEYGSTHNLVVSSDGTYVNTLLLGDIARTFTGGNNNYFPLRLAQVFKNPTDDLVDGGYKLINVYPLGLPKVRNYINDGESVYFTNKHSFYFKKKWVSVYKDSSRNPIKQKALVMYGRQFDIADNGVSSYGNGITDPKYGLKIASYDKTNKTITLEDFHIPRAPGRPSDYNTNSPLPKDFTGVYETNNVTKDDYYPYAIDDNILANYIFNNSLNNSESDSTFGSKNYEKVKVYDSNGKRKENRLNCVSDDNPAQISYLKKVGDGRGDVGTVGIKSINFKRNDMSTSRITIEITLYNELEGYTENVTNPDSNNPYAYCVWRDRIAPVGTPLNDRKDLGTQDKWIADWMFLKGSITLI